MDNNEMDIEKMDIDEMDNEKMDIDEKTLRHTQHCENRVNLLITGCKKKKQKNGYVLKFVR